MKASGIHHLFTPWNPPLNGLRERTVRTVNKLLLNFVDPDIHVQVTCTYWAMKTRPLSTTSKTSTELMGQQFSMYLSQLHPASDLRSIISNICPKLLLGETIDTESKYQPEMLDSRVIHKLISAQIYYVKLYSGEMMQHVSSDYLREHYSKAPSEDILPSTSLTNPRLIQVRLDSHTSSEQRTVMVLENPL